MLELLISQLIIQVEEDCLSFMPLLSAPSHENRNTYTDR